MAKLESERITTYKGQKLQSYLKDYGDPDFAHFGKDILEIASTKIHEGDITVVLTAMRSKWKRGVGLNSSGKIYKRYDVDAMEIVFNGFGGEASGGSLIENGKFNNARDAIKYGRKKLMKMRN